MPSRLKLQELVNNAQNGDQDAVVELVNRFIPLIKKHSRLIGYEEASADLVVWIVNAIYRYETNTNFGEQKLKGCSKKNDSKK